MLVLLLMRVSKAKACAKIWHQSLALVARLNSLNQLGF